MFNLWSCVKTLWPLCWTNQTEGVVEDNCGQHSLEELCFNKVTWSMRSSISYHTVVFISNESQKRPKVSLILKKVLAGMFWVLTSDLSSYSWTCLITCEASSATLSLPFPSPLVSTMVCQLDHSVPSSVRSASSVVCLLSHFIFLLSMWI